MAHIRSGGLLVIACVLADWALTSAGQAAHAQTPTTVTSNDGAVYAPLAAVSLQRQFFAYNELADRLRKDVCRPCGMEQFAWQNQRYPGVEEPGTPLEGWTPKGWVTGYGFGGSIAGDPSAEGGAYTGGGVQTTFGYQVTEELSFGFFYDFGASALTNDFDDKANSQAHSFGGYFTLHRDCDYFLFAAGGGFADSQSTRIVGLASAPNVVPPAASGKFTGGQTAFYGEYGRDIEWANAELRPYFGVLYMNALQNALEETGAGVFDLSLQQASVNSFRTILGSELDLRGSSKASVIWTFRAAWMHECVNDATAGNLIAGLVAIPGSSFLVARSSTGSDWLVGGCGIRGTFCGRHFRPFANCNFIVSDRQSLYAGSGGIEWAW